LSQSDLDLTTVENTDLDKLVSEIESFYKKDTAQKTQLSYDWERDHMMLDGNQWIEFTGNRETGGQWRRLEVSKENEYIPRPVTNYLFDAYQTLKGFLLKNDPRITVRPNTLSSRDKTAAKVAELISEVNWERLQESYNYEYAASVLLTYGTVFKKTYWDSSFASLVKVPRMEQRPVVDPNTGLPTGSMQEVQASDPETGAPLFDELPLGDVQTQVIEPYSIALDPLAKNLHDARWIMEYSIRPLSWIKENYDKQDEGFTGRAIEVEAEKSLPNSLKRFYQLATSSGTRGNSVAGGMNTSSSDSTMIEQAAIVKEYYERPTQKNPKGRLVVVANSIPLYAGAPDCDGPEQGDWHPYSECRWEIVPGRFWGKGPLANACEIQKQVNGIDSVITLTRKTMAVPQKMVPKGSIAKNNAWTGRPGQVIEYVPGAGGESPNVSPAMGVHEQVFQERAQKVEDIKNITGAIDILKGDRPNGVTAHSALSLLLEAGTGKLYPMMKRWKKFTESDQKKQLKLTAKKYREPRPEFIRQLMMKNQDLAQEQIQQFIGQDLHDNCNVVIEASSSIPRLRAAEEAQLMEMANMNLLGLENPKNRAEFFDRLGIKGFDADYTADVKRAEWENDMMDNITLSPDNRPIMLEQDNHDVHIAIIDERMKQPAFVHLPEEAQQTYLIHREEHMQAKMMAEQQQMMQSMMTGQPPQPQQNPMQQPPGKPKQGTDQTKEVQNARNADLLGPNAGVK
jgi:hypothetical protein